MQPQTLSSQSDRQCKCKYPIPSMATLCLCPIAYICIQFIKSSRMCACMQPNAAQGLMYVPPCWRICLVVRLELELEQIQKSASTLRQIRLYISIACLNDRQSSHANRMPQTMKIQLTLLHCTLKHSGYCQFWWFCVRMFPK